MKKIISIILSIVLVIGCCSSMFLTSAFASTEANNDFENSDNWVGYNDTDKTYVNATSGTVAAWAEFEKNTDKAYIVEGDSSLCFKNASGLFSTFVFNTKKYTDYTLKFKYYSTKETTPITRIGVIKNDYNVEFKDDQGFYVYMNDETTLTTTDGVHSHATRESKGTATNYIANSWNELTLSFNSAENTSLSLVVRVSGTNVYFDDFSLTASNFMENPSAWTVYSDSSTHANETNGTKTGDQSAKVTKNTDAAYVTDGSSSLLISNSIANHVATVFDVNKNTDYKLKFKYYSTDETTPITRIGVIKNDNCIKVAPTDTNKTTYYAFMNASGSFTTTDGFFDNRTSDSSKNTTIGYTPNAWSEIELAFNSYENDSLTLVIRSGKNFYIDNIVLTEIQKKSTITFNTNGGSTVEAITGDVGSAIPTITAPTKANHTFEGWYTDEGLTESFTAEVYPESDITLYAKWTQIKYIETAHNQKAAMLTAEAAPNGKQGIRIYNKINKTYVSENVNEFGSIVIREGFLKSVYKFVNGTELTLDTTADIENSFTVDLRNEYAAKDSNYSTAPGYGLGISYEKDDAENAKLWSEDETSYEFTAFIVGIEPKYYDDIYFIRTYAILNDGAVAYGDVQELCIYDQVSAILDPESNATQTDIEAANAIIAQAEASTDDSVVTYEEWLAAKNTQ